MHIFIIWQLNIDSSRYIVRWFNNTVGWYYPLYPNVSTPMWASAPLGSRRPLLLSSRWTVSSRWGSILSSYWWSTNTETFHVNRWLTPKRLVDPSAPRIEVLTVWGDKHQQQWFYSADLFPKSKVVRCKRLTCCLVFSVEGCCCRRWILKRIGVTAEAARGSLVPAWLLS